MCPRRNSASGIHDSSRSPQRGFALVSAIFLVVVLAALGAFMVTLSTVQNVTSTQDLQGSRAYQAARAGVEWGTYQVLQKTSCVGSTPLSLPAATLTGFTVTVGCTQPVGSPFTEGANQISVYQLTSTAKLGTVGSANYVERQISASIDTCRIAGVPCPD
ncbi:MAG: hypothetical protein HHJ12_14220 [Glaciimonas sp.]|nr:hypothetical protein [Glaciimonas sp.]